MIHPLSQNYSTTQLQLGKVLSGVDPVVMLAADILASMGLSPALRLCLLQPSHPARTGKPFCQEKAKSPRYQNPRKHGIAISLVQIMIKLNVEVTGRTYSL